MVQRKWTVKRLYSQTGRDGSTPPEANQTVAVAAHLDKVVLRGLRKKIYG